MTTERKFLVVDDDSVSRLILEKMLSEMGYEVLCAENGEAGWRIFQKEKEHIYFVMLDWLMPKMNGMELCKKIRNVDVSHYVYIVLVSAKSEKKDVVAAFEA